MNIDLSNLTPAFESYSDTLKEIKRSEYIYLFHGTIRKYLPDIKKNGLLLENQWGPISEQVKDITDKKVIFLTSTFRVANIYTKPVFGLKFWEARGEILICKVRTDSILHSSGRDLGSRTVDEYIYSKDIPASDIVFESDLEYCDTIRQNPHLWHPDAAKPKFEIAISKLHGKGLVCIANIGTKETITWAIKKIGDTGDADKDWELAEAAHFINHSVKPNTKLISMDKGTKYILVAIKPIHKGEELVTDYNDAPDFVGKPDKTWN